MSGSHQVIRQGRWGWHLPLLTPFSGAASSSQRGGSLRPNLGAEHLIPQQGYSQIPLHNVPKHLGPRDGHRPPALPRDMLGQEVKALWWHQQGICPSWQGREPTSTGTSLQKQLTHFYIQIMADPTPLPGAGQQEEAGSSPWAFTATKAQKLFSSEC